MRLSKKFAAIAITAGVALTASAAFAFWTTTGGGSGSGSIGSTAGSTVGLSGVIADGLFPGGSVDVAYKATNAGSVDVAVGTVHAVITTPAVPACASYLHLDDVLSGQNIPAHTAAPGAALTAHGTLSMDNPSDTNQDSCKTVAISLALSSIPS